MDTPHALLYQRYPALTVCRPAIDAAVTALIDGFSCGGKLLLCGNGGSCADCDHIAGELMKGFLEKRPLPSETRARMREACPALTEETLTKLQQGLPAIPLAGMAGLFTAFCNDVDPKLTFAQSVLALGQPGDMLLGISTSGNAENVLSAARVARARGLTVLALTGKTGGALKAEADIAVCVPETETYRVQELHLPVYHALCSAVEAHFFAG